MLLVIDRDNNLAVYDRYAMLSQIIDVKFSSGEFSHRAAGHRRSELARRVYLAAFRLSEQSSCFKDT